MDDMLQAAVEALRKQLPKLEDASERGLESGLERARDWAHDNTEPAVRAPLLDALDRVEASKESLAHLAGDSLSAVLERVFLGLGADAETRADYFPTALTYEQTREAMQERTRAKLERQLAREESWDEFTEMLEEIGMLALRAVLPLLLAAL